MFVLQAAVVKGRGGIATAVAHYERMFAAVGVRSAVMFRGPSLDALRGEGFDVIEAPPLATSPLAGVLPLTPSLRDEIAKRAKGEPIVALVHSDLTLPTLRRVAPRALFVTPCHSDKMKHKAHVDLVVALNADQAELARARLPGVRVAMLGNPYVAPEPAPLAPPGAPRINFVARFTDIKDPLTLVKAAALIKTAPKPEFRFIGAGPLEAELHAAAASANAPVTFPGWVTAPFAAFHGNDILVLPSSWEGLPYLLQEALDHGVPIVAAANSGNRAALADGAFGALFPFGDAPALAVAIDQALADLDALRAKAEKGRAALKARYAAAPFWAAFKRELDAIGKANV